MAWDIAAYRPSLLVVMTLIAAGCFTWAALRSRGLIDAAWLPAASVRRALAWGILSLAFALSSAVRLGTGNNDAAFLVLIAALIAPPILIAWFTPIEPRRSDGIPSDHVPER